MLQSFAKVEKDPDFQSKKYVVVKENDRALSADIDPLSIPVKLKHPDNVIVVASPTGSAPPPVKGERRFSRLSKAVRCALVFSKLGHSGCSIVVHPGLYFNPGLSQYTTQVNGTKLNKIRSITRQIFNLSTNYGNARIRRCASPFPSRTTPICNLTGKWKRACKFRLGTFIGTITGLINKIFEFQRTT